LPATAIDRDVEQHLRTKEIRYTPGRRAVVTGLAAAVGPRSAAELHADINNLVPLSSLYRTLAVLEEAGVIVPHFGTKGLTRYELAEWITGHHHHLICISCGAVDDIDIPAPHESEVRRLVDEIGETANFTPVNHTLDIEGKCARCQ
jgi:Fe2+ or Zn2+ uptake regulation protein